MRGCSGPRRSSLSVCTLSNASIADPLQPVKSLDLRDFAAGAVSDNATEDGLELDVSYYYDMASYEDEEVDSDEARRLGLNTWAADFSIRALMQDEPTKVRL